jgi:hypothetical protein
MAQVAMSDLKQDYRDESFLNDPSTGREPAIDLSGCLPSISRPLAEMAFRRWRVRSESAPPIKHFAAFVQRRTSQWPRMSTSTQKNSEAPDSRLIFLPHSLRRDATRQAGATDPTLLQGDRRLYRRTAMMALAIHTMIRGSSIPSVRWASTRRPSDSSGWLGVLAIFALFWRTCKFWSSAYDRDHG